MTDNPNASSAVPIPPDDLARNAVHVRADDDRVQHISLVGDTHTILFTGKDTAGAYTLLHHPGVVTGQVEHSARDVLGLHRYPGRRRGGHGVHDRAGRFVAGGQRDARRDVLTRTPRGPYSAAQARVSCS